ncbi:MAG: PEP-CTERM sorting domain-containing protein, partial [Terriglobales bacterium]
MLCDLVYPHTLKFCTIASVFACNLLNTLRLPRHSKCFDSLVRKGPFEIEEAFPLKNSVKAVLAVAIAVAASAVPALAGNVRTVPEPASLALLASGIAGLAVLRRV